MSPPVEETPGLKTSWVSLILFLFAIMTISLLMWAGLIFIIFLLTKSAKEVVIDCLLFLAFYFACFNCWIKNAGKEPSQDLVAPRSVEASASHH